MSAKLLTSRTDEEGFRAFVAGNQSPLLRLAVLLTGDQGAAEDLVQTAFVRLYPIWPRIKGEDPIAYTRRIVVNANHDRWRRHRGREKLTAEPPEREGSDPTSVVVDRDAVLRALGHLSTNERRVVVLRFVADMSEAQTAVTLELPLGTVKSTCHRALAKLRNDPSLRDLLQELP